MPKQSPGSYLTHVLASKAYHGLLVPRVSPQYFSTKQRTLLNGKIKKKKHMSLKSMLFNKPQNTCLYFVSLCTHAFIEVTCLLVWHSISGHEQASTCPRQGRDDKWRNDSTDVQTGESESLLGSLTGAWLRDYLQSISSSQAPPPTPACMKTRRSCTLALRRVRSQLTDSRSLL